MQVSIFINRSQHAEIDVLYEVSNLLQILPCLCCFHNALVSGQEITDPCQQHQKIKEAEERALTSVYTRTNTSSMPNTIYCHNHGECEETFVCSHLIEHSAGLGFNRAEPSEENPFPDAWCDDCNLIFQAHDGWNEESEKLARFGLLCSGCYEQSRIRNTLTDVSFEELSALRWQCGSCEDWHTGPCLDFSFSSPYYWTTENEEANQINFFSSGSTALPTTFLDEDVCVIDDDYFIRGIIHLPIIGTTETFRWGVWGSVSRDNFEKLLLMNDDPARAELEPMFSWLSSSIAEYPETLSLKMYAHIQEPGTRPMFELEPTDHPLSQEYHHGITPERVKEIMMRQLDLPVM